MKFIIKPQNGIKTVSTIVWNAEGNAAFCEFIDGEFETDEAELIAKLIDLGYEYEDENPVSDHEPKVSEEKLLRDKAKELGIKSYHLKSVETLTAEIAEIERV